MRHQCKRHKLGRPQDQRKAVLRSLASSLFLHGEIKTTMAKAKALKPYAEHIISLAKKGDVHARRTALKYIYDQETGRFLNQTGEVFEAQEGEEKLTPETVLRKLFNSIAKDYSERKGGYTRIFRLPPRRGDAAEMALIQLV
ncbi:MAG: 50S ribosomal protein L17 [Candidatus Gastranaerophilales bacterium]|nr:50S ribosomal protein L17 [Candidatus Gastranaerophilales bacterium]